MHLLLDRVGEASNLVAHLLQHLYRVTQHAILSNAGFFYKFTVRLNAHWRPDHLCTLTLSVHGTTQAQETLHLSVRR